MTTQAAPLSGEAAEKGAERSDASNGQRCGKVWRVTVPPLRAQPLAAMSATSRMCATGSMRLDAVHCGAYHSRVFCQGAGWWEWSSCTS